MFKLQKVLFILIIFVILIFVGIKAECSDKLHGNVQFGFVPDVLSFEAEINLQYTPRSWIEFYAGISVLMKYGNLISYAPYRDTYIIGAKFNITNMIYFDLYHHCVHGVWSISDEFFWDNYSGGSKTRLAVGLEW